MKISVRFFATLKDRVGASQLEIEVPENVLVGNLLAILVEKYPDLEASLETMIVAVNQEFAEHAQILYATDEIVLFPPVSGG
jgi:molybdopterin synthase sulfur carrier subunit